MLDALKDAELKCATVMDLLIEGMWYIFTADGHLSPEESACLAHRLDDMPVEERRKVIARFSAGTPLGGAGSVVVSQCAAMAFSSDICAHVLLPIGR